MGRPQQAEIRVALGRFPTPVRLLSGLPGARGELWLKDDGVASDVYGGNKVRKLERTLAMAQRKGARRIVTVGAAGSHHVLATALFARRLGLKVRAVLCPQPWNDHAEQTLRLLLGQGIEVSAERTQSAAIWAVMRVLTRGDYFLPPGGSNVTGTLGYVDGLRELAAQVRSGELPEPDLIVAAIGSGGTVAGILAGVKEQGLGTRVMGVAVATRRPVARCLALGLGVMALRRLGRDGAVRELSRLLVVDDSELGRGYGYQTDAANNATAIARGFGLQLDQTYTAKAFSAALRALGCTGSAPRSASEPIFRFMDERRASGRPLRVVYWHTLSSQSLEPIEQRAHEGRLPAHLGALLPRS